jgi:uncharacterized glyoxalase superfamily protein PhnB
MNTTSKLKSVAPIFQVANMQRAINYYTRVLGFGIEWTAGEPPTHVSVSRDSVEISLTMEAHPVASRIYIEVDEVDDYFGCITSAGALVKAPLADRPYGMRDGRVDDPDGNSIQLGEPLVPATDV